MFGYVIPNQAALSPEAQARYRTAYCGLCRRIGALHGLRGRLTLSQQPGYEEEMREIFELLLARCARSFERLPCVEDADLLRNILYSGVWLKYNCKNAKKEK